jgi:plasmid stability protein
MSIDREAYPLRLPTGMRDRIRQRAAANRRSMNSEIVHYLDRALAAEETKSPATAATVPGSEHDQSPSKEKANERACE